MPVNFSSDQIAFLSSANALQKMWGADSMVGLLKHIGVLDIEISNTAPTDTTRLWFDPNNPSTDAQGVLKKHDGSAWKTCSEAYLTQHIVSKGGGVLPSVTSLFSTPQRTASETVTFSTGINFDFGTEPRKILTLTGNVTLNQPLNIQQGAQYVLDVRQDSTGGRTITWNSVFKFAGGTPPTISTAANARDVFYIDALSSTELLVAAHRGVA